MASVTVPHRERLRGLIEALQAPAVQLWGWPGTGKRAFLETWLQDEETVFVPRACLAGSGRLEGEIERIAEKTRWLVAEEPSAAQVRLIVSLLRPNQRLLFASDRRLVCDGLAVATSPQQLLLTASEVEALWDRSGAGSLTHDEAEELRRRSDGWLLPLRLWSRDSTLAAAPLGERWDLPMAPVEAFFRSRVLERLDPQERGLLFELAHRGEVSWERVVSGRADGERREGPLHSLVDAWGLVRVEDGALQLPRSLASFLEKEACRWEMTGLAALRRAAAGSAAGSESQVEPDVRIKLLGSPRVERRAHGEAMVPVQWGFKRPLKILAYLASAPDLQASKEEVVSILWSEASEEAIRRNLHPTVSRLRRAVWPDGEAGAVVLLRDGVYSLDPNLRWEVDLRVFLDRYQAGARALAQGSESHAAMLWEEAWGLYDGPFCEGFADRWILAQRDEIQLHYLDLLRRLGDLYGRSGRRTEAEDAYRTLLLEDPLDETVHAAVMRIYAERGRRDLVKRQFERLRRMLLSELAVEPSAATLDLYNELLSP